MLSLSSLTLTSLVGAGEGILMDNGDGVGYTGVWLLLIDDVAEGLEPCLY